MAKARATYVAEEHLWDVACWDGIFDDYTVPFVLQALLITPIKTVGLYFET